MHPSLQQRVDRVAALRARSSTATAALHARIGKKPRQKMPCHAATQSKAIELATRKVNGFRWTRKEAVNLVQPLDVRAAALADIERKIAEFFGSGERLTKTQSPEPWHPPARSLTIDPATLLKRRRSSPTRAVRIAIRRLTEAL